jgi:hypothetical protein
MPETNDTIDFCPDARRRGCYTHQLRQKANGGILDVVRGAFKTY